MRAQSHVIKFAREVMHPPAPGLSEDVHAKLCRYIDTACDQSQDIMQLYALFPAGGGRYKF